VYNPRNTESVNLFFRGQKTAKVVGSLAMNIPNDGSIMSGILVRRNFNYHLLHPNDLNAYTELSNSRLSQRESVFYDGSFSVLIYNLRQLSSDTIVEEIIKKENDDENLPKCEEQDQQAQQKNVEKVLLGALHELCGPKSKVELTTTILSQKESAEGTSNETQQNNLNSIIELQVDGKSAQIDPKTLQIANCSDQLLHHLLTSITQKMAHTVLPI
uniref:Pre-mRNA 3'-end-processing endonuclease polyadenylation factor C-term domain-containing protein n=1 Tax=Meloidogyne javanica TaxID=6303 RepID=A0A915MML1_MELJA